MASRSLTSPVDDLDVEPGEVVELGARLDVAAHLPPARKQLADDGGADEAGSARNQSLHGLQVQLILHVGFLTSSSYHDTIVHMLLTRNWMNKRRRCGSRRCSR